MQYFLLVCLTLLLSALEVAQSPAPNLDRASEIWERALAAKGGREKIATISNFLVVKSRVRRREAPTYVDLFIFPDKYWSWLDLGGVLGTNVWVHDGTGKWNAHDLPGLRGLTWFPPAETDDRGSLQAQAMFLIETPWFHPRILSLATEQIGREDFDVITVDAVKDRVKYYIDRQTSLVRRVGPVGEYGNAVLITWDLMDYRSQDGIMLPSRMISQADGAFELEFGLNVEYSPDIFTRRPAIEDGPDGWKPSAQ